MYNFYETQLPEMVVVFLFVFFSGWFVVFFVFL